MRCNVSTVEIGGDMGLICSVGDVAVVEDSDEVHSGEACTRKRKRAPHDSGAKVMFLSAPWPSLLWFIV